MIGYANIVKYRSAESFRATLCNIVHCVTLCNIVHCVTLCNIVHCAHSPGCYVQVVTRWVQALTLTHVYNKFPEGKRKNVIILTGNKGQSPKWPIRK